MNTPRLHILTTLLMMCLVPTESLWTDQRALGAQVAPPASEATSPATEVDTQLRINKTTLLENKNDKHRADAALLLLASEDPATREFLLDVLKRTDNPAARIAVCEALNATRQGQKPLRNKEDFVKPLVGILTSESDFTIAKPAAEATLLFGYSQVQQELEKAATDPALPVNVRANVIYALRRHPDKQAVAKLITLLESPEPQIVEAARTALVAVGISVGLDPAAWRQMLIELQQRTTEVFLRERVIWQETRKRELEAERDVWQKRYLTSLNSIYDSLTDETAKNAFMTQQLTAQEIPVRSWALDKLDELRKANAQLKLSGLSPDLLALVSDPSKQVRQKTARLLAKVAELNAAKPLLEQLKIEQDDQVRREILVALREACYVGSLATTGYKVPDEVRKETLEWAVKFLREADAEKARSGAEVIGKLLEQDGLKREDVERYLRALSERFAQASAGADPVLRGSLLGAMAGLCASRSTCRDQATTLYRGLFEQALVDSADPVRQAAVDGLVNVDNAAALRKLREERMTNDTSGVIRLKVVGLAGEIGGPQDLDWLVEKLGVPGEGDSAWQAMLKVFKRSDTTVLANWAARVGVLAAAGKIVMEQSVSFFTLVEQTAQRENKPDLLKDARRNLARLHMASGNFKQASEHLEAALAAAVSNGEKEQLQSQLLRAYLELASMDQACELITKCLSAKDLNLSPDCYLVKPIEEYLISPTTADQGILLAALQQVKVPDRETSRAWQMLLSRWVERFAKAKKLGDNDRVNN